MDIINQVISQYGVEILGTILTGLAAYLGLTAKKLVNTYLQDKTIRSIAKIVAQGIEQCYKELHGEEKLDKALEAMSTMLQEKGITISEFEMKVQLENAVGEFNKVFEKDSTATESENN